MSNPFELSGFVDQHRRRLQAKKESVENPREAFSAWISGNAELVEHIVQVLSGPDQPNYFLALHEPGNLLPRKFMEVLCDHPSIKFFEGTTQLIPGNNVLDAILHPQPVAVLMERWEQSPNASRFALNVLAVLAKISVQPVSAEDIRDTLTKYDSVFAENEPKTYRDGKAISTLAKRLGGKREPLEFPNSRLPEECMLMSEMTKLTSQCDLLCEKTEHSFNIKSLWGTHVLTRMEVWEPSSTEATGMQVRIRHDEAHTRDNFDVIRKIVYPQWQAPEHIEEKVRQWVSMSQSYDSSLSNRLGARRADASPSSSPSPRF